MPGLHSHQRSCDLADAEVARFADAIRGDDPATPVPTCGRWRMDDLIQHVGHIHRWAAAMVAERSPHPAQPPEGRPAPPSGPRQRGRRPTTDPRLTVTGDPALLAHWRQHAII